MTKASVLSAVPGIAVGVATALSLDKALIRYVPERRVSISAALLAGAGAVYPIARSKNHLSAPGLRELAGLGACCTLGIVVSRSRPPVAARLVAVGWASHAMFDLLHETGRHSKIPGWYPAFCGGYDVAVAVLLTTSPLARTGTDADMTTTG